MCYITPLNKIKKKMIIDHFSLASEFILNSLKRSPTKINLTFGLFNNKITILDDSTLNFENDEQNLKEFDKFLEEIGSQICDIDCFITYEEEKAMVKKKLKTIRITKGEKQKNLSKTIGKGVVICLSKIFNKEGGKMTTRLKELLSQKEKFNQQKKIINFINSLSLIYSNIAFHVKSSLSTAILDLPPICQSNEEKTNYSLLLKKGTIQANNISRRFDQITGSFPLSVKQGTDDIFDCIIKTKIDLFVENKFDQFILVNENYEIIPFSFLQLNGIEIKPEKNQIKIIKNKEIINKSFERNGLRLELIDKCESNGNKNQLNDEGNLVQLKDGLEEVDDNIIRNLEFVGIWDNKFILATFEERILYAIDQHAAHERINLSKLTQRSEKERYPKDLKKPIEILDSFGFPEPASKDVINELKKWGWRIQFTNDKKKYLTSIPCVCNIVIDDISGMIQFANEVSSGTVPIMPYCILHALRTRACKTAIRFGDVIDERRAKAILKDLAESDRPNHCAHGRTVVAPILDFERPLSKFSGI